MNDDRNPGHYRYFTAAQLNKAGWYGARADRGTWYYSPGGWDESGTAGGHAVEFQDRSVGIIQAK